MTVGSFDDDHTLNSSKNDSTTFKCDKLFRNDSMDMEFVIPDPWNQWHQGVLHVNVSVLKFDEYWDDTIDLKYFLNHNGVSSS
mmetsp:Transcript_7932/g.12267  ORF Transcript_7932/g.12267 Transcript_7932/m.12267 type:complete len:83 (-) Transcript_7932:2411-2659(-)